jgi:hypothetical protein
LRHKNDIKPFFSAIASPPGGNALGTNELSKFDPHYVVYLKTDAAKEPIAVGDSAPGTLADAAHKAGRTKSDFELVNRDIL